jgi:hypothetical protein
MAPPGVERPLHEVWEAKGPFKVNEVFSIHSHQKTESGRVAIIVEDFVYSTIQTSLDQYQTDLSGAGYTSVVSLVAGGTPEDLRSYLIGLYNEPAGLVGAVLVGDVPYIIYELMQDWDGSGGDPPEYEDFPCDIFFMDMDGTWLDDGAGGTVGAGNGKYDGWSDASKEIEIWVGRLKVDTLPDLGWPGPILNNYFTKNHLYRTGGLGADGSGRALAYVDDDWGNGVTGYGGDLYCLELIYNDVTAVYDVGSSPGNNATASDYKSNHMVEDYQIVMLRSHGYPGGHGFYQDYRTSFRYVSNNDYRNYDPEGLFYSCFVCSGCDYTAEYGSYSGYLGGTIAFNEDYGLLSWGSTKTGGMWNDIDFYSVLDEPNTFGAAFVNWFNESHDIYGYLADRWWYGMVLIGDPALIPNIDVVVPHQPLGLTALNGFGEVELSWNSNAEPDVDHYNIYRAISGDTASLHDEISAPDTTYDDTDVVLYTTYVYWVSAVDGAGNESELSDPDTCWFTGLTASGYPEDSPRVSVLGNYPNPFNNSTEILFSLGRTALVEVSIYDVSGRRVKTLLRETLPTGVHSAVWNGSDQAGLPSGSGVYMCRVSTDRGTVLTKKVLLLE